MSLAVLKMYYRCMHHTFRSAGERHALYRPAAGVRWMPHTERTLSKSTVPYSKMGISIDSCCTRRLGLGGDTGSAVP
eukprot:4373532-Prymnesium_polylepis.1